MPTAVLPGLGDIDHAGDALNDGPVLGLRHGELVRQLPLASHHSLPVGEQHGLPRHRKADDDRQGDACRQPKGPASSVVVIRPTTSVAVTTTLASGSRPRTSARVGRETAASLMGPRGRFPRVISTCSTVHRASEFRSSPA